MQLLIIVKANSILGHCYVNNRIFSYNHILAEKIAEFVYYLFYRKEKLFILFYVYTCFDINHRILHFIFKIYKKKIVV